VLPAAVSCRSASEEDRAGLKDVLTRCPELDTAAGYVRDFGEILSSRLGATLPAWIDAVDASQLPGLTGFALERRTLPEPNYIELAIFGWWWTRMRER
jgi:hypothetical protein